MSKPALGRGLGGLLSPPKRTDSLSLVTEDSAKPTGVQLLLRGENGQPIAPPPPPIATPHSAGERVAFPSWALGCLVVVDAILVLLALWIGLARRMPGHLLVASVLLIIGGGLLAMGVWLRGERGAAELQTMNPFDPPAPSIRVQFLHEKRP